MRDISAPRAFRIQALDAARGAALCFSGLSHFAWMMSGTFGSTGAILKSIAMVATPAFLLISATAISVLAEQRKHDSRSLRITLVDRGLFLLIFGHVAVSLSLAPHF